MCGMTRHNKHYSYTMHTHHHHGVIYNLESNQRVRQDKDHVLFDVFLHLFSTYQTIGLGQYIILKPLVGTKVELEGKPPKNTHNEKKKRNFDSAW